MNEQQYVCAVARLAARYAARFPIRRLTGRAARPARDRSSFQGIPTCLSA